MQRSRLKNIINMSKGISNKKEIVGDPFDRFLETLPKELVIGENYRMKAAWKAYGSPSDYKEALWEGMIQPIDENTYKLPSIGYNEETDEYEYLNKGKENETVAKDIRVWDNDVIPFVQELKRGGFIRVYNEEKDCWTYSKNKPQQEVDFFQKGGKTEESDDNLSLEEFLNRKIQERTEDAIRKATTRKFGYKFKNKDWKNCVATATDNYGVPIVLRNSDLEANPNKYGFMKLENDGNTDNLPMGVLIQDFNKPGQPNIPGHTVMYVGKDEEGFPLYSYSSGDSDSKSMHNYARYNFDSTKMNVYKYIGTPAERAAWEEEYKAMYPQVIESHKQGGQMSVIPEGALHARKNNMEGAGEDFTAKGIPVVDNEGEQQAEIERDEIIFRKEVTDKMEELYKKFNSEESSDKKDEIAIEMGKIITCEITKHTQDNTGLIDKIQNQE